MKIIVYNSKDQYALSRKQIEKVRDTLPSEYFAPIQEFHLIHSLRGAERFEFVQSSKVAYFYYPVEQKISEIVNEAIIELLIGLARIKSNTKWGYPLGDTERVINLEFAKKWHQKCIAALS